MKVYRAALRALEACEARDAALARREALWAPSRTTAWDEAHEAYRRDFDEANRLLDEYRRVRLEAQALQVQAEAPMPVQCRRLDPMQ